MSRIVIQKSALETMKFLNAETIEKSKKGEMRGGEYIHREEIAEKTTTDSKGNKRVTRYRYYYVDDMLKDSADTILDKIMKFFYKKYPENKKKIEESYKKENIEKDYGADKKSYYQHIMEYLSHRALWDKKFSKKEIREKYKKPIINEIAENIYDEEIDVPEEKKPVIEKKPPEEKKEKKWKPNTSLMRKIWSMNTGKTVEKEEKQQIEAQKKLNQVNTIDIDEAAIEKEADETQRATLNTQLLIDGYYKRHNANTTEEKIVVLKKLKNSLKSNEKHQAERIEALRNYTAWNDSGVGFFNGEIINKKNVDEMIAEYDRTGGKSTFNEIQDKYIADEIQKLKNELEEHNNRSNAMLGNDNAKKYGLSDKVYDKYVSDVHEFIKKQNVPNAVLSFEELQQNYASTSAERLLLNNLDDLAKKANVSISEIIADMTSDYGNKKVEVKSDNLITELLNTTRTNENRKDVDKKVKELFKDVMNKLPADKKQVIMNACSRNNSLTSYYGLENCDVTVYPTGIYFELKGTRVKTSIFVDNEGNVVRKKGDNKLWTTSFKAGNVFNFEKLLREENNEQNNINIEQEGIPGSDKDLREPGRTDSNENVSGPEITSDNGELLQRSDESGIGSTVREEFDFSVIGGGSGKLTPAQARKIRAACHKLLDEKTDDEMTNEDKALLAQFVGAGGTKEKGASNTGILTEFYTPRKVVNKCWELLDKWLPNKKTCIEPSSGIGRFTEGRPEKFTMFELEEDSARIAKILHPNAEVVQGPFEKNWVREGRFYKKQFEKFDCSVGNPPYMEFTGTYKGRYGEGKEFVRAEQYFLNRTLDSLKDNGVLVFVMPSSFLSGNSAKERKAKELIASKGKLLEAWRLPNGSFDTTEVGTDIIVVRKEKGDINDFISDNYFKNNPTHIAGDVVQKMNQFGDMVDYVQTKNGETFDSAIDGINANDVAATIKELPEAETIITETPEEEHKNRSDALKGNKNAAGKHNYVASTGKNMTAEEFNHKYGMDINQKDLEIWKFTDYNGHIDTIKLTAEQRKYIENSKNYVKDGNEYVNIVNYASGNIREKLNELEVELKGNEITKEDYDYKKSLLETAMPAEKKIGQFNLSAISDWTRKYLTADGMNLIQGFYEWIFNGHVNLQDPSLPIDSPIAPEEIPPEISFKDVVDYIERKEIRSSVKDGDTKVDRAKVKYRKAEKRRETAEALFNKYLQQGLSLEDQTDLTKSWNNNFNAYKNPDYEQMPIFIDGMNEKKGTKDFTLTKQQLKGISFLINKGSGLLAYDVGVGKTVTGLCATINQIQTGRSKRPLICVPNAVYEKWIEEIHQHFPEIKVNELKNFSKGYISKDYVPEEGSISICTYEALEKITFKDETMHEIDSDVEYAMMHKTDKVKSDRQLAKEGEKAKELAGRMTKSDDDYVYFEDLGFDHITVDEVHNFKNIFYAPRNVQVTTEGKPSSQSNEFQSLGGGRSDRGEKLFAITQYIQRHNDNRNVFGLSATPFQNSPIEIYNILSLFARQRMKDLGIYSLEEFVKQFAKLKSEYVVTATSVEEKMVMKSFNNLTALQNLITEYIDKVDGGEAHVIRPRKETHLPELEMTDLQRKIMEAEAAYLDQQSKLPKDDRDPGSTLGSLNAMRMATLSPALVREERYEIYRQLGFDIKKPADKDVVNSSPKLRFVCDSVIEQYKKASNEGQVIYMPRGVSQYKYVVEYLVKNGVPADAITEMAGSGSEKELIEREKKIKEFNDVDGKCKIIIGSETIKEGVSLNGNSTVLYNCMLGWNPSETQQVEGRIWRQGNKQGITHIVYPLLHDSIDPMLYQKYDEKKSRINDLYSYKGDTLNVDEIDAEELKFGLIKDPMKRADLQSRQFKEKAESDEKLYSQMVDVISKQAYIAFNDLSDNKAYKEVQTEIAKNQKLYDVYKESHKQWTAKRKTAAEDWNQNAVDLADKQLANIQKFLDGQKEKIDSLKKDLKRFENAKKSMIETLAKRGIKTYEDAENKKSEYRKLMLKASADIEKAEEMKEEFYQVALKDQVKKNKLIPSMKDMVQMNVEAIRNNLHPMDEEFRAKLVEENNARYGLNKSLPVFFFMGGRFLVRK